MTAPYTQLPAQTGIGLRLPHMREFLATRPAIAWVEVHTENYFGGGANLAALHAVREHYPLSLHGVGLGLGSACGLDPQHLAALVALVEQTQPAAVSEHLCWNRTREQCFNDLLPLPYTRASLDFLCRQIDTVQNALRRPLLIENLSSYLAYAEDDIAEGQFLAELAQRSGCGILLDINNLYVNQANLGRDARAAIDAMPAACVAQYHLAGFEVCDDGLLLDTHGGPVHEPVWRLYDYALQRIGVRPTLLEWDTRLPPLADLLAEAGRAQQAIDTRQPEEALHND